MANDVLESFDNGWSVLKGAEPRPIPTASGAYLLPTWRLRIPGYEAFTICIHKSLGFADVWVIAEGTTGLKMCDGASIDDAIATLDAFLADKSPQWFGERIEEGKARKAAAGEGEESPPVPISRTRTRTGTSGPGVDGVGGSMTPGR